MSPRKKVLFKEVSERVLGPGLPSGRRMDSLFYVKAPNTQSSPRSTFLKAWVVTHAAQGRPDDDRRAGACSAESCPAGRIWRSWLEVLTLVGG